MIVFLLLIIIAILLFGATAIRGAIGGAIGVVAILLVVLFAAYFTASALGADLGTVVMCCFGGMMVLALVGVALDAGKSATVDPVRPKPTSTNLPDHVRQAMDLDRKLADDFNAKVKRPARGDR